MVRSAPFTARKTVDAWLCFISHVKLTFGNLPRYAENMTCAIPGAIMKTSIYIQYVWKIEDVQLQLLQTCDLKSPRVFFGIQAAELHFFRLFRHNFGGGRNHRHSGSNHRRSRGHSSYLAVEMIGLSGL